MRFLFPASALLLAGCASTPSPAPVASAAPVPAATNGHDHRTLNGMTANELVAHFGKPRLQIREGEGTKIQFIGPACVLDTYLYSPTAGRPPQVTYVEARNFQGGEVNAQNCVYAIEARGSR